MTSTEMKTQEYVVVVGPEYAMDAKDRAAKSRALTIPAASHHEAGLAAVRALTGKTPKTLKSEGNRYSDPATVRRFATRRDRNGDSLNVVVHLSPAEKQRIADAKAAEEAAKQAQINAAAPEREAYEALLAANPGVMVYLSLGHVRVEWKAEFDGDYSRIEVKKDQDGWRETAEWKPATVQVGSVTLKDPRANAVGLIRAIRSAAAIASMLDAEFTGSVLTIPEEPNPTAASYRAHTSVLTRVIDTIAAAQTVGAP